MEFTDDVLKDMRDKQKYNSLYGKWYYGLSQEYIDTSIYSERIKKRGDKIGSCLDLWVWDKYELNKILDLKKVNRCMNNRFCPNCKKLDLAGTIHNFKNPFSQLLCDGYNPYLLTLTVPNCTGGELRDTIDNMNKAFRKFFNSFNYPLTGVTTKGFSERLISFDAALKVLEITYNEKTNLFHPHFHIMIFSKDYPEELFKKCIPGAWSNKKNCQLYNSHMDMHIMKVWKMCYDKIRMSAKNYSLMSDNWFDNYMCDIKEMDQKGIYEVLKYTFKDSDIKNYYVFKTLVSALENKRIRQGYGLLYGLKCENETDGEIQSLEEYLELDKKETPQQLLTKELNVLIKEYHEYKKISRFKAYEEYNIL